MARILLVEKDIAAAANLARLFTGAGHQVWVYRMPRMALRGARIRRFDLTVLGLPLAGVAAARFMPRLHRHGVRTAIVVLGSENGEVRSRRLLKSWGVRLVLSRALPAAVLIKACGALLGE